MCNTFGSCGNNGNNGCGCGCGNNGNHGCGCGNGYDPLLAALKNLFAPLGGCGCGCGGLYLVQDIGTVQTRGGNNGCGCGNNGNNGGNNGCGCGCGNTYDAYYVRQYALNSCCNG